VNERLKSMLIAIRDELSNRSLEGDDISDEMNIHFRNWQIHLQLILIFIPAAACWCIQPSLKYMISRLRRAQ